MEKYGQICESRIPGYALVSLKIKRFRIFNRLNDRSLGDLLVEKVYEVLDNYLEEDEYIWIIIIYSCIIPKITMNFSIV